MHRPMAVPMIPASASGVSTQRSGPYLSRSPAVARNTPPARPTSSPITITFSSRLSSTWKQSLIASTSVSSAIEHPPELREVGVERLGRIDESVLEQQRRIRGRFGLGGRDPVAHRLLGLTSDRLGHLVGEDPRASQVALVAPEALALALLLDPLEVDVRLGVVRRRVRRGAVRHGLDERRPLARSGARYGFACRLVHREDVEPVHPGRGHPVSHRLVRQGLRPRLRRDRRRDRPPVVVAEEDERRTHHGREVRALVERPLGGGAVPEVRDRTGVLAAQPLAPREARRVRHVRRDRHANRRDVVVRGVPPAGGMTTPPRQHRRRGHPAQEPDRRLAIAGEDPVVVLECVHGAGLHRLVVPVDRVRPDPALAVVDDRALVVRAEQDEAAVELDEVVVGEPVHLAVGHRVAVPDDAAQVALRRQYLSHYGPESTAARRTSAVTRTIAPITAATPSVSRTSPPPPVPADASAMTIAPSTAAPAQASASRASLQMTSSESLQAGTRLSIDQNASSATSSNPAAYTGASRSSRDPSAANSTP